MRWDARLVKKKRNGQAGRQAVLAFHRSNIRGRLVDFIPPLMGLSCNKSPSWHVYLRKLLLAYSGDQGVS
jgi:hypothetical protein